MRFWDTSAVAALVVAEPASAMVSVLVQQDPAMVVWWGTPVACRSALARRAREGVLDADRLARARQAVTRLMEAAYEVTPTPPVRDRALRLLDVHDLRAADALQLAAALAWTSDRPRGAEFVSLDQRLRTAVAREGFGVAPSDLPGC